MTLSDVFVKYLGIYLFFIIVIVALWVIRSIGETYVLKSYGRKAPGLAWIPVAGLMFFVYGARDEDNRLRAIGLTMPAWIPSLFIIWAAALSFIPVVGIYLAALCMVVFYGAGCIKVYSDFYCGGERMWWTIPVGYLSGVITIFADIYCFGLCCRRYKPDGEKHGIPARRIHDGGI